jgi:hypothetical protein
MKDLLNYKMSYNTIIFVLILIEVQLNGILLILRPVSMLKNIIERIITFKEKAIPRITKNICQ